ncbi:C2 family cysteine protease [Brachybacterium horti]
MAPRILTWRRGLRALLRPGGARAVVLREDDSPLWAPGRPRQGMLGDCWVMASMLAVHETAPERLRALLAEQADGAVLVTLPGAAPMRVERSLPVDEHGSFLYGRIDGHGPGWAGVLEKAIAEHVAGGYGFLQWGLARYGLQILTGGRGRMLLRSPDAATIRRWRAEHRAITASTHPLSPLVGTEHGPLPPNHVFAVVDADPRTGHVLLRNPVRPAALLRVDSRSFRRGFLAVDVTAPLR